MFVAPKIEFGEKALESLKAEKYNRALVFTDKNLRKLGYLEFLLQNLNSEKIEIFDEIDGEPDVNLAIKCSEFARKVDPEVIIALGGGSVIDLAKFARVGMEVSVEPKDVKVKTNFKSMGFKRKAKLIAVPTTSGSGADATLAVMLKDGASKISAINFEFIPDLTILDYRVVEKMPKKLVASTGIDALAHAIEAYLTRLHNELSDIFALRAVELILSNLEKSFDGEMQARAKMHLSATMAGVAINNSQLGAVHALAHAFGTIFKVDHSLSIAIFLPKVLKSYIPENRLEELSKNLGFGSSADLVKRIEDLIENISLPSKASELVKEDPSEKLNLLVDSAMKDLSFRFAPKSLSREEALKVFKEAF
ncbi:MAG: iron-containing alcohol dehydrogenase [Archaeoglobaceae archaeon]|nr:iron-containing alcohol dehydrogenase [Archaeoglobaceae archaeon]MDW8118251.1 iron-containing alcohol dehydrogenase [Archaeoglobaceae archaeon]